MDRRLFIGFILALLGGISSLMLWSVSPKDASSQLLFALMGLTAYGVLQFVPRRLFRISVLPAFIVIAVLLVFTLVLGHTAKGASRWFSIGPVRIQVSEVAKPILALTLSTYVTHFALKNQKRLLFFFLLAGAYAGMVLLQPDLGSALVLAAIAAGICMFSIPRVSLLIPWVLIGVILSVVAWNFVLYPYQKQRLFSFLGTSELKGSGYNAEQAIITVGSGKLWGRGIGHGVQTNLRFLPEHHTDFFFASYAEETGLIGVIFLLTIFACLFIALLWNIHLLDGFDQVLRFSFVCALAFQTFVHVFMNMGFAPVTGIPLPFLSSGGSSFVSLSIFLGLVMRFHRSKRTVDTIHDLGFMGDQPSADPSDSETPRWSFAL